MSDMVRDIASRNFKVSYDIVNGKIKNEMQGRWAGKPLLDQ